MITFELRPRPTAGTASAERVTTMGAAAIVAVDGCCRRGQNRYGDRAGLCGDPVPQAPLRERHR
ncbi:MAG: hypothetical protein ACREJ5_31745, partial [Geminicoccaceae bacterium]